MCSMIILVIKDYITFRNIIVIYFLFYGFFFNAKSLFMQNNRLSIKKKKKVHDFKQTI